MDLVTQYYDGIPLAPMPPPTTPPPPMSPPPHIDIVYIYELKQEITMQTAALLWSFFSESYGIYLEAPFTKIICSSPIDVAHIQKKIRETASMYDIPSFNTVYILPAYIQVLNLY
jgi:hypothetical protein